MALQGWVFGWGRKLTYSTFNLVPLTVAGFYKNWPVSEFLEPNIGWKSVLGWATAPWPVYWENKEAADTCCGAHDFSSVTILDSPQSPGSNSMSQTSNQELLRLRFVSGLFMFLYSSSNIILLNLTDFQGWKVHDVEQGSLNSRPRSGSRPW